MRTLALLLFFFALALAAFSQTEIQGGSPVNFKVKVTRDAEYPGGNVALYKSLGERMRHLPEMYEKHITGDIMVSFNVEPDSTTSGVRAMQDLGGGTKDEAERLIRETKFVPAIQNGKPVRQQLMLPVLFRIYE
jgi:periplasmic protein TonB